MIDAIGQWALNHRVSVQALTELLQLLATPPPNPGTPTPNSEAAAQGEIRLAAPEWGGVLWRNNVGAWTDENGIPIRYGLANDSRKLNRKVKSSDLIGFLPMLIGYEHVGRLVAVLTAIDAKRGDWKWTGTKAEVAQQRFINIVRTGGGIAGFARNRAEFEALIRGDDDF